jgi:hypothetical protein
MAGPVRRTVDPLRTWPPRRLQFPFFMVPAAIPIWFLQIAPDPAALGTSTQTGDDPKEPRGRFGYPQALRRGSPTR